MDCGPQCLSVICSYYGYAPDFETIRTLCGSSKSGVSMFGLRTAAESIGFDSRVIKVTKEAFHEYLILPCIAFVDGNHFIVVSAFHNGHYIIEDPASGRATLSQDIFLKRFYCGDSSFGYVLELKTTERLKTNTKSQKGHSFISLLSFLKPYKKEIAIILLTLIVGCGAQLILPIFTQKIVDIGIETKNLNALAIILAGEAMLVFSSAIASLIQGWVIMFVGARVNFTLVFELLGKLVRLPMHFFDSRRSGDILTRVTDQYKIENFLTRSSISITISGLTFLVFSAMTLYYSLPAFIIMIIGNLLYIFWTVYFLPKRRLLDYETFKNMTDSQDCIIETINGMPEIKLNDYYGKKSHSWFAIQKRTYKTIVDSTRLGQKQELGSSLIAELTNIVILFFAASQVISGRISLGAMLALQYITGQMIAPIQNSVGLIHDIQDASIAYERQQDIIKQKEEKDSTKEYIGFYSLQEDITLSNISFSYEGAYSPALKNINLTIPANKVTAIVGASGSGKTTLVKLLLGFYQPMEGKIVLNGKDFTEYDINSLRNNCGAVLQEGYIFSDTIIENIIQNCPFDQGRFNEVVQITNVTDFVHNFPLGYNTIIGETGHGLSLGQKQRILIARAIYKNPEILLFDEATNSLDAKNEQDIWTRISKTFPGKTVIVSAHRLSTIRLADQIVVMKNGEIVEVGNHIGLMEKKGEYFKLVSAQLS